MKYKEWLNEWLKNYIKPTTKEKTYTRYAEIINKHIIPQIGLIEINDITPLILQQTITTFLTKGNLKTGKGLASNSVNSIINVIKLSLKTAYSSGITQNYIGDSIRRPKTEEKEINCFSVFEQNKIQTVVVKSYKLFGILLCLYTGIRIGELLALKWSDIDFINEEISITKTSHDSKDANGKFCIFTNKPKTPSSKRIIPIPKKLMSLLKEYYNKRISEYVVCTKNGKNVSTRSYQETFKRLLINLKLPIKNFHSLRHTFATRALECGMDVKTLSEILGHKSPTITLNRYVHSLIEHKKEMMNRLGKNL